MNKSASYWYELEIIVETRKVETPFGLFWAASASARGNDVSEFARNKKRAEAFALRTLAEKLLEQSKKEENDV